MEKVHVMTGRRELTAINVQPGLNEFFLKTEKKNVPTFSFSSGPDPATSFCRSTQSEKLFWGSLLISRFWKSTMSLVLFVQSKNIIPAPIKLSPNC